MKNGLGHALKTELTKQEKDKRPDGLHDRRTMPEAEPVQKGAEELSG